MFVSLGVDRVSPVRYVALWVADQAGWYRENLLSSLARAGGFYFPAVLTPPCMRGAAV